MDKLFDVMNVSSTTALKRKSKPLEAAFLATDDPRLLWLKYQILIYFENWLKTIEVRSGVSKSQRDKKFLYNHKSVKGIKTNVHTVIEQASIINMAERFSQDPLETYFCKQHPPEA